ncbi:DNA-directed RNA polymerase subunit E' [Encephalitozoon intestinalis ATCC 50506]|uniref:DNA-directed RNA polymerase subunit E n=1 Tax=Encephalitozoon intestinalis (strain ATCC 50506) TaxID=876142 RepID=E0S8K0_ENCIT|nr:DNA-directed RNA polymerase subunit E' [Encephalitozoon intestinalis ATCC 50506]ADM11994.1 DNA-directed RNA polymerase subunit E' [Encephalitozoon intestinalis ATCC 50506]UTX45781.1 DNA-directed RNA polymerase subunit [Encephalitozoon intestinalis]
MFYSAKIEDKIKISLNSNVEKKREVFEELKKKYVGRTLENTSMCVLIERVIDVYEYKVYDEFLVAEVEFEALFFRFFKDEVGCGTILEQNEKGIRIGVSFFHNLWAKKDFLPSVSEKAYVSDCGEKQLAWVWIYRENKLYFRRKSCIRFRVLHPEEKSSLVLCGLNEAGLGPLEWWV